MRASPFVAVVGPTGSGKSELALAIAEVFSGEIVNCDSLQVFRYFDIGTAKLPAAGRRGIPHHIIDIRDPSEIFTAGDFARLARASMAEIAARGRLPIVAGGTGLYLRALIDGLAPIPPRDESIRERLSRRESLRPGSLSRILRRLDPAAAAAIHANDTAKLIRALEVMRLARRRLSDAYSAPRDALQGWRSLLIGLNPPRDLLYARLNQRAKEMFESGLIEEVRSILARGFPESAKPFESLGYKQALQVLHGAISVPEAIASTAQATRRYAKRQLTWFRADSRVQWRAGFGSETAVRNDALDAVRTFLEGAC